MALLLLTIYIWLHDHADIRISRTEKRYVDEAMGAFNRGDYLASAKLFDLAASRLLKPSPGLNFNAALAHELAGNNEVASVRYTSLSRIENNKLKSMVLNRRAILYLRQADTTSALALLREAIILDTEARQPRFNYELIKTRFSGIHDIIAKIPKEGENSQALENRLNTSANERDDELGNKKQLITRLRRLKMTEEEAQNILDALKANEGQNMFQLRKAQFAKQNPTPKTEPVEW